MTAIIHGDQLRTVVLGTHVAATDYSLAVETHSLFTVSGGDVLITSLVGKVTTGITVANTVKLQANPTTGATGNLCAATDVGTTDSPAGDRLSITGTASDSIVLGVGTVPCLATPVVVAAGTIEQVTTGTGVDGAITWYLTYVPLDDGASVTAA